MSGLVDHDALHVDLKGRLLERRSWGLPQLLELLAVLEHEHRIDESAEAAMLRRFQPYLVDTFLGLMPEPATSAPLAAADPSGTAAAMDGGATSDPLPLEQTHGNAESHPRHER